METELLDRVEEDGDDRRAVDVDEAGDEVVRLLLAERPVDELDRRGVDVGHRARDRPCDLLAEDDPPGRREQELAAAPVLDRILERDLAGVEGEDDLLLGAVPARPRVGSSAVTAPRSCPQYVR